MSRVASLEPVTVRLVGRRSLADLVWVANTRHGAAAHWFARPGVAEPDHDHLEERSDAVDYLRNHRVEVPAGVPTAPETARLTAIRDVVRQIAEAREGWEPTLRSLLSQVRFGLDLDERIVAPEGGWAGFVDDLLLPLIEFARQRDRVSICANPACRLVFIDDSRNRTRRWCDNAGCGNRFRVRRYRETRQTKVR
jgi:hypothetical protein